jgi:hypothetical protein
MHPQVQQQCDDKNKIKILKDHFMRQIIEVIYWAKDTNNEY